MVEKNKASTTPALLSQSNIITGVSTQDRVTTIKAAISPTYKSADVISPGHTFPLVAHPDGLSSRRGTHRNIH
ncbi:hypothetical protein BGI33_09750 [Snodgrassella alvi]|nr:hypothetical protein BGI33_09750 [Snodgrassella alvi]PIT17590.1 hypothetical protein BGI34_06950 [Snodgrassella alvi]